MAMTATAGESSLALSSERMCVVPMGLTLRGHYGYTAQHKPKGNKMTSTETKTRSEKRKAFLHTVFTTALEGGIGYWSIADEYHWSKPGFVNGANDIVEDRDGFYAVLESNEDDWGVQEAFISETDEVQPITETQALRVDIDVIERGVNMLVDYVIAATKTEDDTAPFSLSYLRQFVEAWLSDGDNGDFDADGADWVVQLGLFGSLVYA